MTEPEPYLKLRPITGDELREIIIEAQHRYGRVAKVPEDVWGAILSIARAIRPIATPSSVTPDLRAALEAIIHTLGPEAPAHDDVCEGCQHEIGEALDIARAALASVTPSEPTLDVSSLRLYGLDIEQIKQAINIADLLQPNWRDSKPPAKL